MLGCLKKRAYIIVERGGEVVVWMRVFLKDGDELGVVADGEEAVGPHQDAQVPLRHFRGAVRRRQDPCV